MSCCGDVSRACSWKWVSCFPAVHFLTHRDTTQHPRHTTARTPYQRHRTQAHTPHHTQRPTYHTHSQTHTQTMAGLTASMKRKVLSVGTTTTLGFDAKPRCVSSRRDRCPTLQGAGKLSAHFRRTHGRGARAQTTSAHFRSNHLAKCFAVFWRKPRAEPSLMPSRAGERVRVLRGAAVLQGWDPANFLVAEAQTALCVIYVEDDDWDWCCAFRQRQVGHVLFSQLEGQGEFILEEPVVPVLLNQDLVDVAEVSDALRKFGEARTLSSRTSGTRCLSCASTTSWRQSSSWQRVHAAWKRARLRATC